MTERSIAAVPRVLLFLLGTALVAQLGFKAIEPRPTATAADLPAPPSARFVQLASLGENIGMAQGLSLYLQAFDTQPGISVPFKDMDYARVEAWLGRIVDLDPPGQYPLLMASQIYSQVPDETRQRRMLEFVYRRFLDDPDRRWRWLAHASIMAKHRLADMPLALRYAQAISEHARGSRVPGWAKQMNIFILEEMGASETARILLGGLLASGSVTDPREIHFLIERLETMKNDEKSSNSSK